MYQLRTLGTLDLRSTDGTPVHSILAQPKRSAILCYLAIATPRGYHRRERIAAFFWPEHDSEHARHSLRQALHAIRTSLGDDAILTRGDEEIALSPAQVWCDVAELEESFAQERWADVVELHRGLLLDGFYVPEATEFEQWVEDQRERVRLRAETAAWKCVDAAIAKHDASGALGWGRRALELAPVDEEPLRRFMRLAASLGDPAAGLGAYEKFRARLKRAYELETSPETEALARELEAAGSPPATGAADTAIAVRREAPPTPRAQEPQPGRPRARTHLPGSAALVLLLLAGAVYLVTRLAGIGYAGTLFARGQLESPVRLVLADFEPVNVDTVVADALTELLRVDLQQSRTVRTLAPQHLTSALARMRREGTRVSVGTALEIAQREGLPAVLSGELREVGGRYLLVATLTALDSTTLLVDRESARDSTDLIGAAERLSHRLRRRIGESLRALRASEPLPQVTTSSFPALVRYTQALHANRTGDFARAASLLDEAVSFDTAFAMAYRLMAAVQGNNWNAEQMLEAADRAFRHRDRLPEPERLKVEAMHFRNEPDYAAEERARVRILEFDSAELVNLSDLRLRQRRFADAEKLAIRALQLDRDREPANMIAVSNLVHAQLTQQKLAAAESALARYRVPGGSTARRMVLYAERDYAGAWHVADSLERAAPGSRGLLLAMLALLQGRVAQAQVLADGEDDPYWLRLQLRYGGADRERLYRVAQARIRRERLDTIPLARRPDPCELVSLLVELGRPTEARPFVADWKRVGGLRYRASADQCAGAIAMAERRFGDAAAAFLRWHQAPFATASHSYNQGLYEAADAVDRMMLPDSAISLYERVVNRPWGLPQEVLWYPFALQRLGELHASRGHPAQAIDYYTRLLELWRDADPPLQRRLKAVKAARDSLLALTG